MKYSKITLKSDYVLPYRFIGSTVRGAFGVGLKKVVCINPSKTCKDCFASEGCLFYDFFETSNPKFRLNLEKGGDLNFDIFLFEEASEKAPYVISAIYKAFSEIGITKNKIKPEFKLFFNDKLIFDKEFKKFENSPMDFQEETISKSKSTVNIILKTPLRVKENNRFVRDGIKVETVLRSIYHRYLKLQNKIPQKLPFTPEFQIKNQNFSFLEFRRFSNRQKTSMNFGGIVGKIELDYIDENSYKLLKIGEIIGVGKQVTFGLGRIEIED